MQHFPNILTFIPKLARTLNAKQRKLFLYPQINASRSKPIFPKNQDYYTKLVRGNEKQNIPKNFSCLTGCKTNSTFFLFEVLQFPAQLIGYSKYIEQNVTDTKCLLNIDRHLQTGNCRQRDDPTKITVWTNPHHGTAEFRLIGRYCVRKSFQIFVSKDYVLILSLQVEGVIQADYKQNNFVMQLDSSLVLTNRKRSSGGIAEFQNLFKHYAQTIEDTIKAPMLATNATLVILHQWELLNEEWYRMSFLEIEIFGFHH